MMEVTTPMTLPEPYYDDGKGIVIYNADYHEILPLLPKVDLILTDQPYGTGWIRGGGKRAGEFNPRKETAEWDKFDLGWMSHPSNSVAAFCPKKRFGICVRGLRRLVF